MSSSQKADNEDEEEQQKWKWLGSFLDDEAENGGSVESIDPTSLLHKIGFWLLSLTVYFDYNVLLSAAHDFSEQKMIYNGKTDFNKSGVFLRQCNSQSTGSFLLAFSIPELAALVISTFFPFYCINFRVFLTVCISIIGIVITATSNSLWYLNLGIAIIAIATGLADNALLSYISSMDNKHLVLIMSSGNGFAGLIGSLWYVILVLLGYKMSTIMYTLLFMPFLMAITYYGMLNNCSILCNCKQCFKHKYRFSSFELFEVKKKLTSSDYINYMKSNFLNNINYIPHLFPFIFSASLVYFFEFYINQCLHELIYFKRFLLTHKQQFHWYSVTYNIAVFLCKSSLYFITVKSVWCFPFMQGINASFLTLSAIYFLLPHFTFALCFIFWEGLMGGYTYSTIFYILYTQVDPARRKFSLGLVSVAGTFGKTFAALIASPAHNYVCRLPESLSIWNN